MIDPKIQAELRAKYNPDGSLFRQHQLRMVEMLKYFDELCQKHDIKYWLSSGNCLGVARHGGFIPWDDDVDVEMLREDYLKLEKVFKETDDYVLQTWKNDNGYFYSFAKMRDKHSFIDEGHSDDFYKYRGVYIDVFPLEESNIFGHIVSYKLTRPILSKIKKKSYFSILKNIIFLELYIFRIIFFLLPCKKLRHAYGTGWHFNFRDKKDIFPLRRVIFEGVEVNVPNDMDGYLKKIYGDYMEIPSEDEIAKSHTISVIL